MFISYKKKLIKVYLLIETLKKREKEKRTFSLITMLVKKLVTIN